MTKGNVGGGVAGAGWRGPSRCVSALAAWAVAFGCAVGWDAFTMPEKDLLTKAGPLGTVIGIIIGGLVMAVIAWNYHSMIKRYPGPGGVYTYATKAFGSDHGFICSWFLCLAYVAIVWADTTALMIVSRYMFGDLFMYGFRYSVAGVEVSLGHLVMSSSAIAIVVALCLRRRMAICMQTVLAIVFAVGIVVCFAAAAICHTGGFETMAPAFQTDGSTHLMQVLRVVAFSPWLFIGFEAISNLSGEFSFPLRRSFAVMLAALGASVLAYSLLSIIPALVPDGAAGGWQQLIANRDDCRTIAISGASLGRAGVTVLGITMIGAVFTNLIGNTIAASCLLAAMADDGVLPAWFGRRNRDGARSTASIAIGVLSIVVSALGAKVIEIIVDVAAIGAGIAYAYTSAATLKMARAEGDRTGKATGLCGLVFSIAIFLSFIIPNAVTEKPMMVTESYLVVVFWCLLGLLFFLSVFRRDRVRRFGHSIVVWISLIAMILFMSVIWIRQTTYETTEKAYEDIAAGHEQALANASAGVEDAGWRDALHARFSQVYGSIFSNSLVQGGITVLALTLMFCLYSILRRREIALEREKAEAKRYFFSTVSHDIRTPLNAIIGFSEMLSSGLKTEEERRQAYDAISVSGKTLLGLINDVLDLSRLESGKMAITPEPTDCALLMRELAEAFRISSTKPDVEIKCIVGDMPLIMIDPLRIRQIVFNLVGNAVKFTDRGFVELRASYVIPKGSHDGVLLIEVEDTGHGISEADLKKISSAYVQVGSKLSRNGGTGLGLAICKQLAEAMGGQLGVKSVLGSGSTFTVEISGVKPAKTAPAPAPETVPQKPVRPAATHRRKGRVLIVDDSKMNITVLRALLRNTGDFEIVSAMDGREALAILESEGPGGYDFVFTDMWMPELDGAGLVRAIRANPALKDLRVVAVTADVEMKGSSDNLGFDGMLFKPVTTATLGEMLDRF